MLSSLLGAALGLTAVAHAETPPLAGAWRAGATAISVSVESWGSDCGPRPQNSKSGGGGVVTLIEQDKALIVRGREGDIRSDACWSRNPSMRKQSSSVSEGVWTTRCKTAQNDPREEQGTYVLKVLGPDTLLYQDTSRYNWSLNTSKCIATFTTSQTLSRARDVKPTPAAVTPAPPVATTRPPAAIVTNTKPSTPATKPQPAAPSSEPAERACVAGPPAKLTLRPKHADIEVGQRVCFHARLADAKDCEIAEPHVKWSLGHSRSLRGDLDDGCFSAARTTAEAEGDFKVSAVAGGLRADASVSVHSVDLSALIAKRMDGSDAVQGFDEKPVVVAPPVKAAARIATRTVSQPAAPQNKRPLWLAATGVSLLLVLGIAALLRRKSGVSRTPDSTPPASVPPRPSASVPPARQPVAAAAPTAVPAGPAPGAMTVVGVPGADATAPRSDRPAAAGEPWICPQCRVGYPAAQGTCPRDGSALMPYAEFNKRTRETAEARQKRCPKCGDLFPASSSFCGKDGSSLIET